MEAPLYSFVERDDNDVHVDLVVYVLVPGIDTAIVSHGYIVASAAYVRAWHSDSGFIRGADFYGHVRELIQTGHELTITQRRIRVNPFMATGGHPAPEEVEAMFTVGGQ